MTDICPQCHVAMAPSHRPGRVYHSERCRKRAEKARWERRRRAKRHEALAAVATPVTDEFLAELHDEADLQPNDISTLGADATLGTH